MESPLLPCRYRVATVATVATLDTGARLPAWTALLLSRPWCNALARCDTDCLDRTWLNKR